MAKNRTQLFHDLNVKPTNPRWSWCAINQLIKRAVFTLWEDEESPKNTWLIHTEKEPYIRPGYKDQKKILDVAFEKNYETFGILCTAKDINSSPRNIKNVKDDLIYKVKIKKVGNEIFLIKTKEIPLINIIRNDKNDLNNRSGIQDLNILELGSEVPERVTASGIIIKRDERVRKAVQKRAEGKCEYCGASSFKTNHGENYLETHHIINLANQGPDKVNNVIALCPNHHREAHFGKNANQLEKEFLDIIQSKIN